MVRRRKAGVSKSVKDKGSRPANSDEGALEAPTPHPDTTQPENGAEIEAPIEEIMALVEPILNELLAAGAAKEDYWLKGKSAQILSDWIVSILNVSHLMEQQIRALGQTLQAQEQELEQLRSKKGRLWAPGI